MKKVIKSVSVYLTVVMILCCSFVVPAFAASDVTEPASDDSYVTDNRVGVGVYYQAFDMFSDFIYGDGVVLTSEQNMVLTILATTAVLFVVVVPFLILFFVLRLFSR